jgi:hypothetical protein
MKTIPSVYVGEEPKDDVVELMKKNKIPLTRQNYLDIAFGRDAPDELHPEHEAMLPKMFQDQETK